MSTGYSLALAAAILGALTVLYLLARRRLALPLVHRPTPETAMSEEVWDPERAVRQLIDSLPGFEDLYQRLGFSVTVERESERLFGELAAQIQVEIPDYRRFRQALTDIQSQFASDTGSELRDPAAEDPLYSARYQRRNDPLLTAILAVKDDPAEVTRLLNRDPVGETLPFVEQIPFSRSGKIVWRTPMEISILRKRPRDSERFARLLGDLDRLVQGSRIRRPKADRDAVLEAIGRCHRDLQRENAYLPTTIRALDSKLAEWLMGSRTSVAAGRRRLLEELLTRFAEQQRLLTAAGCPPAGMEPAAIRAFGQQVQALGDDYVRTPWMHAPALTACTLNLLLAAELAPFSARQRRNPSAPGGMLALICAETASGRYDSIETIRRLHQLEEKGTYVHSLIFALLRLHRPSDG